MQPIENQKTEKKVSKPIVAKFLVILHVQYTPCQLNSILKLIRVQYNVFFNKCNTSKTRIMPYFYISIHYDDLR